jgi:SAM-dependent methyltransferase
LVLAGLPPAFVKKKTKKNQKFKNQLRAMSDASQRAILEAAYSGAAAAHRYVTFDEREQFRNAPVRKLNNFVKACVIDIAARTVAPHAAVAAEGLRVCDVACGRGQDNSKWKYAAQNARVRLRRYYALDLVDADVDAARDMALRYLPADGSTDVRVEAADMTVAFPFADACVDVVSCQLALHYACDAEARLERVLAEAARVLARPHGLLLLSFTDGRAVVRRVRDALTHEVGSGAGADYVTVRREFYSIEMAARHARARLDTPFGRAYTFTMHDSVAGVPEFLCNDGAVAAAAARHGFAFCAAGAFDACARAWTAAADGRFGVMAATMYRDDAAWQRDAGGLDAASLYRWMAFSCGGGGGGGGGDVRARWAAAASDAARPEVTEKQPCKKVRR